MSTEKALAAIQEQQAQEQGHTAPWMVGEQLKDMIRREPAMAQLVFQDLTAGGMSLREAEKKIKAYADKHKTGNFACVTPEKAEEIIREYFGLTNIPDEASEGKVIDLADFF